MSIEGWRNIAMYLADCLSETTSDSATIKLLLRAGFSQDAIVNLGFNPQFVADQSYLLTNKEKEDIEYLAAGGFTTEQIIYLGYAEELVSTVMDER